MNDTVTLSKQEIDTIRAELTIIKNNLTRMYGGNRTEDQKILIEKKLNVLLKLIPDNKIIQISE